MATVADYAVLRNQTARLSSLSQAGTVPELRVPWSIPQNFVAGTNLARPLLALDIAIEEQTDVAIKLVRSGDATGPVIARGNFTKGFFGQHLEPFLMPNSFNNQSELVFEPEGGPMRIRHVIVWFQVSVPD